MDRNEAVKMTGTKESTDEGELSKIRKLPLGQLKE